MNKQAGLWIDHRKAVIVTIADEEEEIKTITSSMEKHVRFAGEIAQGGAGEDARDRQFGNHLNGYYDEVIAVLRDVDSILIFGPGEAKGELEKRLEHAGLKAHILAVETTDKMTDRQIAAKVRASVQTHP
ncbi:MAG: hypothetical protein ABI904_02920 [Chloroflexota bacterium]